MLQLLVAPRRETQADAALPSGEAEMSSAMKGVPEGIGRKTVPRHLGEGSEHDPKCGAMLRIGIAGRVKRLRDVSFRTQALVRRTAELGKYFSLRGGEEREGLSKCVCVCVCPLTSCVQHRVAFACLCRSAVGRHLCRTQKQCFAFAVCCCLCLHECH